MLPVLLHLISAELTQELNNGFRLPAFLHKRVCTWMSVCLQLHVSFHVIPLPPISQMARSEPSHCVSHLHCQKLCLFLPWEPVLSIKLLRLNREVLEAKYWMNLWERDGGIADEQHFISTCSKINSLTPVIEDFTFCFVHAADWNLSKGLWSTLVIIVCDNTQLLQHLLHEINTAESKQTGLCYWINLNWSSIWKACTTSDSSASSSVTNLVAMDTHVMSGDESLENDHPACIGGPLKQRVSHLRDVHVGGVGGWHQVCNTAAERSSITDVHFLSQRQGLNLEESG